MREPHGFARLRKAPPTGRCAARCDSAEPARLRGKSRAAYGAQSGRAVAEINEKLPSYKRIRSYKIRESAFEKTTTQKIKRFGDNMKDE